MTEDTDLIARLEKVETWFNRRVEAALTMRRPGSVSPDEWEAAVQKDSETYLVCATVQREAIEALRRLQAERDEKARYLDQAHDNFYAEQRRRVAAEAARDVLAQQLREAQEAGKSLAEAALAYDAAIQRHATKGESWTDGDDLDALYFAWLEAARALSGDAEAATPSAGTDDKRAEQNDESPRPLLSHNSIRKLNVERLLAPWKADKPTLPGDVEGAQGHRIPVLVNHDPHRPIGRVEPRGRVLRVTFLPEYAQPLDVVVEAFGSCRPVETRIGEDGAVLVVSADVFEFSVPDPSNP